MQLYFFLLVGCVVVLTTKECGFNCWGLVVDRSDGIATAYDSIDRCAPSLLSLASHGQNRIAELAGTALQLGTSLGVGMIL